MMIPKFSEAKKVCKKLNHKMRPLQTTDQEDVFTSFCYQCKRTLLIQVDKVDKAKYTYSGFAKSQRCTGFKKGEKTDV